MKVRAQVKNLKVSPRKTRLVISLVRGMKIDDALAQLHFVNKSVARDIIKLIKSAKANALHAYTVNASDLFIKEIWADEGLTMKRWMPRAFGRATPLRKRSSHVTVVLGVPEGVVVDKKVETVVADDSKKSTENKMISKSTKKEKVDKNLEAGYHEKELNTRAQGKHRHNQNVDGRMKKAKGGTVKKIASSKNS